MSRQNSKEKAAPFKNLVRKQASKNKQQMQDGIMSKSKYAFKNPDANKIIIMPIKTQTEQERQEFQHQSKHMSLIENLTLKQVKLHDDHLPKCKLIKTQNKPESKAHPTFNSPKGKRLSRISERSSELQNTHDKTHRRSSSCQKTTPREYTFLGENLDSYMSMNCFGEKEHH
jgi:hypothetical protein